MKKNYRTNNNNFQSKSYNKMTKEKNINYFKLEKDICILLNYLRTNPLDYSKNIKNEEKIEIYIFLQNIYNKEIFVPLEEVVPRYPKLPKIF